MKSFTAPVDGIYEVQYPNGAIEPVILFKGHVLMNVRGRGYKSVTRISSIPTGDLEIVEPGDYTAPEPMLRVSECTCGAKHTSNPRFHLNYCALK
jgi:hypothetical protein